VSQVGGSKDVRLRLLGRLDRETVGHYSAVLVAVDGGSPRRSASLVVNIVVTDTNDNVPQFEWYASSFFYHLRHLVVLMYW